MSSSPTPYDAAIEDVEGKIRQLQAVLETLRSLRAAPADGSSPSAPVGSSREGDTEIRHDTFFGMTIADAARKYLTMVKHTKSTADIASALESGGMKHASKDFNMTLRSVLSPREEFVRVNSDWGLTEWYPGMGRGRKAKVVEKPKKDVALKPRSTKPAKKSSSQPKEGTRKAKILNVMQTAPEKYWTAREVTDIMKDPSVTSVQSVMTTMISSGELTKGERGYRLP